MTTNTTIELLEMEKQLSQDHNGAFRDRLCETLRSEQFALKRHMDAGLPPDQFERAEALRVALESAIGVIEKVWEREHRSLGG